MLQERNRIISVVCLVLLLIGSGMYVARNSLFALLPESRNFFGGFFGISDTTTVKDPSIPHDSKVQSKAGNSASSAIHACAFEASGAPAYQPVFINEIAWMGMPGDAKDEWMEFKNNSSQSVALGAWQILNQSGTIKIVFDSGAHIAPGELYLLGKQKMIGPGIEADTIYNGTLNNSGDHLRLFDNECRLMDEVTAISAWPAGDNKTKHTMERDSKTHAWHASLSAGGTPKQENSILTTPDHSSSGAKNSSNPPPSLCAANNPHTLSLDVRINEVAWAGTGSAASSQEWIELKNTSLTPVSLAGWQLQNAAQSIKVFFDATDSIPALGLYLLERGSGDFIPGVKADRFFTNAIKNNDEAIRLFDAHCTIVDEVIANVGSQKQWPGGTTSPGYRTLERSSDASWHTYQGFGANGILGTPRAENSPPPASVTK